MKLIIDENVCSQHNLKLEEVLCALTSKLCSNLYNLIDALRDKGVFYKEGEPMLTSRWNDEIEAILLESDNIVPTKERCASLAEKLRELFPKGIKSGNAAWRGNVREITLRLQKFFKLYGNKWTDEQIINATSRYINHFNGNYTFMRILKYFILKSEKKVDEEGNGYIEDISELATWLENDTEVDNDNWLNEVR